MPPGLQLLSLVKYLPLGLLILSAPDKSRKWETRVFFLATTWTKYLSDHGARVRSSLYILAFKDLHVPGRALVFIELSSLEDGHIPNKGFSGRFFQVDRLPPTLFTMEVTSRGLFFTRCQFSFTHSINFSNYKSKT